MAAGEGELERMLDTFKVDLIDAEHELESEFRAQPFDQDPVRPFSWLRDDRSH